MVREWLCKAQSTTHRQYGHYKGCAPHLQAVVNRIHQLSLPRQLLVQPAQPRSQVARLPLAARELGEQAALARAQAAQRLCDAKGLLPRGLVLLLQRAQRALLAAAQRLQAGDLRAVQCTRVESRCGKAMHSAS